VSAASVVFITPAEAIFYHDALIRDLGGLGGIRDANLLESALAAPQASWGGEYLHSFPWEMAAALLIHLVGNHAFVDGNKRTATACALAFLNLNNFPVCVTRKEGTALLDRVARKEIGKAEVAEFFAARLRAL
jgi:death-on-curing protein